MERYIRWFAGLDGFYQLLVAGGLVVGIGAVGTAAATENPLFLLVGAFWLVVAPAVVWVAARREKR
ncbi:hypothetical protein GRX03_10155 [Halovenus sp. WSH3]|uniref:Uncharacterized protein n=1 Tax=Halovenus carboxidivorans TaxID=2692199 RepID=A0A6B0TAQ4_9EURY|nr:hypothetical protein [Halovenus carboxidivorans]MXR51960.1 hypothetical protein [Halovenus carboxidivorans]